MQPAVLNRTGPPTETARPPEVKPPVGLSLEPRGVARSLTAITAGFACGQIGVIVALQAGYPSVYGLVPLFNLDEELNLPSFYSVLLLLGASLACAAHWRVTHVLRQRARLGWGLLTSGFLVMALDEGFSFHERITEPLRARIGANASGLLYDTWVLPALAVVLAVGSALLPWLRSLERRHLLRYLVSGAVYLGGAVGIEMFEGRWEEVHRQDLVYNIFVLFEETGEMLGTVLFIRAALEHLRERVGRLTLEFGLTAAAPKPPDPEVELGPIHTLELLTERRVSQRRAASPGDGTV